MDDAPILHQMTPGLTVRDVEEVRARRASLRRASATVREVLATPRGVAPAARAVLAAVRDLDVVWASHTSDTERADGVLDQILADCPRLSPAVSRLRREHEVVADALRAVERLLEPPGDTDQVDQVTAMPALTRVLATVDRHRRDGRKLIYDAYDVDLGLGE